MSAVLQTLTISVPLVSNKEPKHHLYQKFIKLGFFWLKKSDLIKSKDSSVQNKIRILKVIIHLSEVLTKSTNQKYRCRFSPRCEVSLVVVLSASVKGFVGLMEVHVALQYTRI